jgi:hypothetical protein
MSDLGNGQIDEPGVLEAVNEYQEVGNDLDTPALIANIGPCLLHPGRDVSIGGLRVLLGVLGLRTLVGEDRRTGL